MLIVLLLLLLSVILAVYVCVDHCFVQVSTAQEVPVQDSEWNFRPEILAQQAVSCWLFMCYNCCGSVSTNFEDHTANHSSVTVQFMSVDFDSAAAAYNCIVLGKFCK